MPKPRQALFIFLQKNRKKVLPTSKKYLQIWGFKNRSGGGIGRHVRLRGVWRRPCGFESRSEHQKNLTRTVLDFFCFIIINPFIYQGLQILHCLTQVRNKSLVKSLKKSIFGRNSANFLEEVLDTYQQLT